MKTTLCLLLTILISAAPASGEVSSTLWQTEKSQHFIIYYQDVPAGFLSDLTAKAEDYYNGIVDQLGFRRFDFWSWDNRAKIFLYRNAEEFRKNTDQAVWSSGRVFVGNRTIESYVGQSAFFDSILPHEMAHIIFREFVGERVSLPLWIDEGIACSQETTYLAGRMRMAKEIVAENKHLELNKLSQIFILTSDVDPHIFYSQSASLVVFLIDQYGKENFLDFSRKLRDGSDWRKALLSAFRFNDLSEMEKAWKAFLLK